MSKFYCRSISLTRDWPNSVGPGELLLDIDSRRARRLWHHGLSGRVMKQIMRKQPVIDQQLYAVNRVMFNELASLLTVGSVTAFCDNTTYVSPFFFKKRKKMLIF